MAIRYELLAVFVVGAVSAQSSDTLKLRLSEQNRCCVDDFVLILDVETNDVDFYEMTAESIEPSIATDQIDCARMFSKRAYFYISCGDSAILQSPSSVQTRNDKWKSGFQRDLVKFHRLRVPIQDFFLPKGEYSFRIVYYSRKYKKCLKSNPVRFFHG